MESYKVVLTNEWVEQISWCDHSNETSASTFTWHHLLFNILKKGEIIVEFWFWQWSTLRTQISLLHGFYCLVCLRRIKQTNYATDKPCKRETSARRVAVEGFKEVLLLIERNLCPLVNFEIKLMQSRFPHPLQGQLVISRNTVQHCSEGSASCWWKKERRKETKVEVKIKWTKFWKLS